MAHFAAFRVLVPAETDAGTADPEPVYVGPATCSGGDDVRLIGNAIISGGTGSGDRVWGCSYVTPGFPVPGRGEIRFY